MKRFALVVLTVWGLGLAASCAKHRGPEAGTNTNWLKKCEASADCDGNGSCLCGMCTLSCSDDMPCTKVGTGTSCMPLSGAACGTRTIGSACLPTALTSDAGATPISAPDATATQTGDCYSPTQNAANAYASGAVGCACEQAGLSICVSNAALVCDQAENGLRWTAVQDGPCEIDPSTCPGQALRPDADTCLAEFATCVEAPTGEFCGRDCHGPLECNRPAGCDYRPFDVADCPTTGGAAGVWEGLCGDVRYRVEGNGYGGPTWFWNAATGALLAVIDATDINEFCNNADTMIVRGDLLTVQTCSIVRDDSTALCPAESAPSCYAAGCKCSRAGLQLCSGGVAMACTDSPAGPTWTLREGVPCDETQTCFKTRQRATADACLAEFSNCDELSDGSFCGGGCYAALDCSALDCEYSPFSGDCSAATVYEGVCGDVRYRVLGGIGSTTWYWDAASGQLLTMVETSDVGDYCGGGDNVLRRGDLAVIGNCQVVMDDTTRTCP